MKKFNLLLMLASGIMAFYTVSAQTDSSGIFKTVEDFQQRKLTYAINCKTEKHKINPNVFFKGSEVKVKHDGTTYELKKSEVFGYRACDGQQYRFVDNKEYKILNPGENLLMYVYKHPSHSPKEAERYAPTYFFSSDAASVPQALTKANVKAAFPDNHKVHDALDAQFKTTAELYAYDQFHKTYKLNWILKNDLK